jgi:uncharacterized protein
LKPLIVNVVELLRWPGTTKDIAVSIDATDFDFGDDRIDDVPIAVAAHLESLSNGVSASGTAAVQWTGGCRRCLRSVTQNMVVEVSELYQQLPDDPDAYLIENDQINLLPMMRENILLAIPIGPLCQDDCPGFCPDCGLDLSEATCSCEKSDSDPRWSVLDQLKGALDDSAQ